MNVEKLFDAIRNEPSQQTLLIAVLELERIGYHVTVANRFVGDAVAHAAETGELEKLELELGVIVEIKNGDESQAYRLHFLDVDAIAITSVISPPVMYDPRFTPSDLHADDIT